MREPSGDQEGESSGPPPLVTLVNPLPSASITKMSFSPSLRPMKAIRPWHTTGICVDSGRAVDPDGGTELVTPLGSTVGPHAIRTEAASTHTTTAQARIIVLKTSSSPESSTPPVEARTGRFIVPKVSPVGSPHSSLSIHHGCELALVPGTPTPSHSVHRVTSVKELKVPLPDPTSATFPRSTSPQLCARHVIV